jgi:hypothetical protein
MGGRADGIGGGGGGGFDTTVCAAAGGDGCFGSMDALPAGLGSIGRPCANRDPCGVMSLSGLYDESSVSIDFAAPLQL